MVLRNGTQRFCCKRQVHRMPRLVLKIYREPRENRIHRLDPSKTPTSVHAEPACRQLHQWFDMVPLQLAGGRHFLEFFSHIISYRSHPRAGTRLLKIVSGEKPREIALQILLQRKTGDFVENLLDSALNRSKLSQPDRALCQELIYGVVRWQATLDWLIDQKTNNRPQKPILRELLRLGLYQIF